MSVDRGLRGCAYGAALSGRARMDLRQLRYYLQVVSSGSFSGASSILHVAQPALSRQVRALEEEMGVQLLHRTGRGIAVTEAGRALFELGSSLVEQADVLHNTMLKYRSTLAGTATVGLTPTVGKVLAVPLARKVRELHPMVNLRVAEGFSGTMLEWLRTGRLDAAVLYDDPQLTGLHGHPVAREHLCVIAPANGAGRPSGTPIDFRQMAEHPLVVSMPHHGLRRIVDAAAAQAGVRLNISYEFDSLTAQIEAVRQDLGWAILPEIAVRDLLVSGELLAWPLRNPSLSRLLVIATAAQREEAMATREISDLLHASIRDTMAEARWEPIS